MTDFKAIADAIATRFSAAHVTPPSGATNIRLSTYVLPHQINLEPTVLVFPPDPGGVALSYGPGILTGTITHPVDFYLMRIRDTGRNTTLVYSWMTALYQQIQGQVHLGLSTYVTHADVMNIAPAVLDYGGESYDGITFEVVVHIGEPLNAVA